MNTPRTSCPSDGPFSIVRRPGEAIAIYSGARRVATVPHPDRIEPNGENDANAHLLASAPVLADSLRRLLTVVQNHNSMLDCCVICGSLPCQRDCAVGFARETVASLPPEFPAGWDSPVPPYDPAEDGDYSSWLVANNID